MTIMKKPVADKTHPLTIDLTGPDGNAYALLGIGRRLSKQLNIDWEPIRTAMTSGDYENLVQVFDDNFGDFVVLYR